MTLSALMLGCISRNQINSPGNCQQEWLVKRQRHGISSLRPGLLQVFFAPDFDGYLHEDYSQVTFQTCIKMDGNPRGGRIFLLRGKSKRSNA